MSPLYIKTLNAKGKIKIQSTISKNKNEDQIINTTPRATICTNLKKKLIILPCQSFCPNIGVNKLLTQSDTPKLRLACITPAITRAATSFSPRPYHHSGNVKKLTKFSQMNFSNMSHIYCYIVQENPHEGKPKSKPLPRRFYFKATTLPS